MPDKKSLDQLRLEKERAELRLARAAQADPSGKPQAVLRERRTGEAYP